MLAITFHKGFHMTFENGVTVSVQFGPGNYCQHNNIFDPVAREGKDIVSVFSAPETKSKWESRDAEVAAWDRDGTWITKKLSGDEDDDVIGYLSADKVLEFLNKAASYKPNEHQRVILMEGGENGGEAGR